MIKPSYKYGWTVDDDEDPGTFISPWSMTTTGTALPMEPIMTPKIWLRDDLTCWTKPLAMPKKVIFNPPATIILWDDGTKTVVKCSEDDEYSKETGIALCFMKKYMGNNGNYNKVFKRWC